MPSAWDQFAEGFSEGLNNAFKPENLAVNIAITVMTIAAPQVMVPILIGAAVYGGGQALNEWAANDFAFNPSVAVNIAGNVTGAGRWVLSLKTAAAVRGPVFWLADKD